MKKEMRKKPESKKKKPFAISYRLKCPKAANGLSHFAMYGDVDKSKSLI